MSPYLVLDIHCGPCQRDGDPNPPRLARFARLAAGGPIKAQTFTYEGQPVIPLPRQRPGGGVTWQLVCPHGHNKPIRDERIAVAFDAFQPGTESMRVAL